MCASDSLHDPLTKQGPCGASPGHDHFGVSIADLKSNKRPAEIAVPRQIVMYLCRKMTDVPLKSIGILLGGKNHSTIKHGVEKIEHDVEENEQLANTIDIIKKKINPV